MYSQILQGFLKVLNLILEVLQAIQTTHNIFSCICKQSRIHEGAKSLSRSSTSHYLGSPGTSGVFQIILKISRGLSDFVKLLQPQKKILGPGTSEVFQTF